MTRVDEPYRMSASQAVLSCATSSHVTMFMQKDFSDVLSVSLKLFFWPSKLSLGFSDLTFGPHGLLNLTVTASGLCIC
jgi:hypothetical protein